MSHGFATLEPAQKAQSHNKKEKGYLVSMWWNPKQFIKLYLRNRRPQSAKNSKSQEKCLEQWV